MKFRNIGIKYYSPDQGAEAGGGGGGQQQGDQGQQQQQQQGQQQSQQQQGQAPQIDYDQLAAAMVKAQQSQQQQQGKEFSYEDHVKGDTDKAKAEQQQAQIESAVKFNSSFVDVLAKNAAMFPERTKKLMAQDFKNEVEKAEAIKKYAAKDFFSDEKNMALLSEANQVLVKAKLTAEHQEIAMTGAEAWGLVENALHIAAVKEDARKQSGMYQSGNEQDPPENVKKFLERAYNKDVHELPTKQ